MECYVMTVLGPIKPEEMGITLSHEHLVMNFKAIYKEPKVATDYKKANEPVLLSNLDWVRKHRFSNLDNLMLLDEDIAIKEALFFKWEGGDTIVEVSNRNHGRDPRALARISRATGINVVMGGGYYWEPSWTDEDRRKTEDDFYQEFIKEILEGVGNSGIRIGIMGEIGCSWPLKEGEIRVLRAAGRAQHDTGVPINIHPGWSSESPMEILAILANAGADLNHVVMSHVDRTLLSHESRCEVARTGCYLEYDAIGREGYFDLEFVVDIPNDNYRANEIIKLIEAGFLNKILLSSDICTKDMYCSYGGHGYGHILRYFVPLLRQKGLTDKEIETILIDNPRNMLTICKPNDIFRKVSVS